MCFLNEEAFSISRYCCRLLVLLYTFIYWRCNRIWSSRFLGLLTYCWAFYSRPSSKGRARPKFPRSSPPESAQPICFAICSSPSSFKKKMKNVTYGTLNQLINHLGSSILMLCFKNLTVELFLERDNY